MVVAASVAAGALSLALPAFAFGAPDVRPLATPNGGTFALDPDNATVTRTYSVENVGPDATAGPVSLSIQRPAGVADPELTIGDGGDVNGAPDWLCDLSGVNFVVCDYVAGDPLESTFISAPVILDWSFSTPGTKNLGALAFAAGDFNGANDFVANEATVVAAETTATVDSDAAPNTVKIASYLSGSTVVTYTATNTGTNNIRANLLAQVPAGTSLTALSSPGTACDLVTATCPLVLNAGQAKTVTAAFDIAASATPPAVYTFSSELSATAGSIVGGTASDPTPATVAVQEPTADLEITNASGTDSQVPNGGGVAPVQSTISFRNNGPDLAPGVRITFSGTDLVGLSLVSSTLGMTCSPTSCSTATVMPANTTAELVVSQLAVSGNTHGRTAGVAIDDLNAIQTDPGPSNNTGVISVMINRAPATNPDTGPPVPVPGSRTFNVLANDPADPEGDALTVSGINASAPGCNTPLPALVVTTTQSSVTIAAGPGAPASGTVCYVVSDGQGGSAIGQLNFTTDAVAPTTTINSGPAHNATVTPGPVSFGFSADDGTATFECKVDDGGFSACTSPQGFTAAAGIHTFSVRATDPAGNVGPSASRSFLALTPAPPDTRPQQACDAVKKALADAQLKLGAANGGVEKAKKALKKAKKSGEDAKVAKAKAKLKVAKVQQGEATSAVATAAGLVAAICV